MSNYHERIAEYYHKTETDYRNLWNIGKTLGIHYGYWDEKVKSFSKSILRMNEVMAEMAGIQASDKVLDAGCGVGGSSIFLAKTIGCHVTGITVSDRQVKLALDHARGNEVSERTDFRIMNYCQTDFPDQSFDVVWGCESICYADSKEQFVREAYRLLKPGGRLVMADFLVPRMENNDIPVVRNWLDGWVVNFLETPENFTQYMKQAGFSDVKYRDITAYTRHSTKRLGLLYYWGRLFEMWIGLKGRSLDPVRSKNVYASRHQYVSSRKGLWTYGMFCATKPK